MEGYDYQKGGHRTYKTSVHSEKVGIIPRIIKDIFSESRKRMDNKHITVFCSFLQIYNEKVIDLLNDSGITRSTKNGLRIRWTKED